MVRELNYSKTLLWIAVPFFVLFIALSAIQWNSINGNINSIKEQNNLKYEKLLSKRNHGPFQIDFKKLNGKQVLIDPLEIQKINNHIDVLTEEVYKESNRAESIIDKDLDRLNLYMTIGIGFMTILGVFVPILVNVLSVQDLRDKQSQILERFTNLETQTPKIEKAINDSNTAIVKANLAVEKSSGLEDLSRQIHFIESKTEKVIPHVCNLILQNSIARFFNISPLVLTNSIREGNFQYFINLLISIKSGFDACKEDSNHIIESNLSFQHTINDFILFLETEEFRFQTMFGTRSLNEEFETFIKLLKELKNSTNENELTNYEAVNNQIDVIISIFENKSQLDKTAA